MKVISKNNAVFMWFFVFLSFFFLKFHVISGEGLDWGENVNFMPVSLFGIDENWIELFMRIDRSV